MSFLENFKLLKLLTTSSTTLGNRIRVFDEVFSLHHTRSGESFALRFESDFRCRTLRLRT